jgi:hypothetical protein
MLIMDDFKPEEKLAKAIEDRAGQTGSTVKDLVKGAAGKVAAPDHEKALEKLSEKRKRLASRA